jgi:hypothetical protein
MMLGALPPTNVSVIKDRIVTTASDPAKVQTFATQTSQSYDPSKGVSPLAEPKTDIMETLKKYAPYIIGAVVLYYVISKK